MPSADEHQRQAEHNARFLETIDQDEFLDWFATAAFYTAVHLIEKTPGMLLRGAQAPIMSRGTRLSSTITRRSTSSTANCPTCLELPAMGSAHTTGCFLNG